MPQHTWFTVGLVGIATTLAACKTIYIPNAVNVPLLSRKNEVRAQVNANNLQGAYAVTDNVGVMVNGQYHSSSTDRKAQSAETGSGGLVEAGGGYFTALSPRVRAEVFGGAGYGQVEHKNWNTVNGVRNDYRFEVHATKLFAQPSVGIVGDWFDAALSTRLVLLRAFNPKASANYTESDLRSDGLYAIDSRLWSFVEPTLTIRGGYKWAKIFFQYGRSFKLNKADLPRDEEFVNVGLSIGFVAEPR